MIVRLPNPMSAIVWLAFLIPGTLFGGRLDLPLGLAAFSLGCAVLVSKPSPWEARRPSAQAFKIFGLLELLCVISYIYSAAFNGVQIGLGDCFGLLRYILLGVFVVYLIRHFDDHVRRAMDWAMAAALYFSLVFPSGDPGGYVSLLTLCYLLFFSRLRLRYLHCAAALLCVFFNGALPSWTAALFVISAASAVQFLAARRARFSAWWTPAFFALFLAGLAVYVHSAPAQPAMKFVRSSPILGWGPAERAEIPGSCNQYLMWLLRSGALGAGLILAGLMLSGYRLLRAASGDITHLIGAAAFLGCVALMLGAGQFLESFRLFFLTAFFVAGMHEASR